MFCRPVYHQGNENQQSGYGQTYRIDHHQGVEVLVSREYRIYPENPGSADAEGSQQCRDKGDAEASEISGHDIIQHTEQICCKNNDQAGVAQGNDLRITVKERQQEFSKEKIHER